MEENRRLAKDFRAIEEDTEGGGIKGTSLWQDGWNTQTGYNPRNSTHFYTYSRNTAMIQ